jgi:hypothetical protein
MVNREDYCTFVRIISITNEEFEDTNKWVFRISKTKKNRQHNGHKEKLQKGKQRPTKHTRTLSAQNEIKQKKLQYRTLKR